MKKTTHKLLAELYAIDPTLQEHEPQLIKLIAHMMEHKPDISIDATFVSQLRERLIGDVPSHYSFMSHFFMNKKQIFVGAGVVLSLFLAVGLYQYGMAPRSAEGGIATLFAPATIVQKSSGAFGNLAAGSFTSSQEFGGDDMKATSVEGRGSGEAMVGDAGFGGGSAMMIAPTMYTYAYAGDEFEVSESMLPVYRRSVANLGSQNLGTQLKNLGKGLVDLSSFGQLQVDNISFYDNDYRITVDILNGFVSIHENYMYRQDIYREARESDILPEDELIRIANAFLQSHGIDAKNYGAPVVDMQWKMHRDIARSSMPVYEDYIPNVLVVIYPFLFEGNMAYDYSGLPEGVRVNVDIFSRKVQSVSNLLAGHFESSAYEMETDVDVLKFFAEKGGIHGASWYTEDADIQELQLGTPRVVYVQHYLLQGDNLPYREVFIPALQFPVTNVPLDRPFYHSRMVTIPLVKDILEEAKKQPIDPPFTIMKGGSTEPSVGIDMPR